MPRIIFVYFFVYSRWVDGERLASSAASDVPRLCGVALNAYLTMVCCSSPLIQFVAEFVAECCVVLQCAAVCCSVLQCVAVCCSVLQCASFYCRMLQCAAGCCRVLP